MSRGINGNWDSYYGETKITDRERELRANSTSRLKLNTIYAGLTMPIYELTMPI